MPTILTADNHYRDKGFTIDVTSRDEYFQAIEQILDGGESADEVDSRIAAARKYWLLYNSHGYMNLGLFEGGWTQPLQIKFTDISEFLPGANAKLDYICDCVISGEPVFGDNRWPPIRL